MLHPKLTFVGGLQTADTKHPDAVTSRCDRCGSTTS